MDCDNVKPIEETWLVAFRPDWSNDESEMLQRVAITRGKKSKTYERHDDAEIV